MMKKIAIIKALVQSSVGLNTDTSSESSTTDDSDVEVGRKKRTRVEDFVEEVVPNYMYSEFKSHFRLSRDSVQKLCELIPNEKKHIGGWPIITKEKEILMCLWYLANQESFRQISDRFGITQSACYSTILNMVHSLVILKDRFIKWPSRNQYNAIASGFKRKGGIPNVLGAIDGSHISINKPKINDIDYVNRKGYHSILLQGVVNDKKIFIDISCGEPGSIHDARLLRKSGLYRRALENEVFGNYFLLGDSAYPIALNWIVPPFKDNGFLTQNQKDFNYRHSTTRIIVENSFALLKGRFRRLKHFENKKKKFIVKCIVAAIVLHNLCIMWDDEVDNIEIDDNPESDEEDQETDTEMQDGITRRDALFNMLYT